jgi:RimJ/RimL family protein N-acetyltransferase
MLSYKSIGIRLVEPSDAAFILSLRLDGRYNKFLSKVEGNLEAQERWILDYKTEEKAGNQFYFIIERLDGTQCGTVRVYDFREDSFCWGSWILNEEKTKYAALESAILIYQFGFDNLGFSKCHFDVMKGNDRVISFHKRFGAEVVGEDSENFYFEIKKDIVNESLKHLREIIK